MSTVREGTVAPSLRPTKCALCGTEGNADLRWPANVPPSAFSPEVFSARRLPDRFHYRIVSCRSCGLVRSDPVLDDALLAQLYRASSFDYGEELDGLRKTYGDALRRTESMVVERQGLLDIGCGNGFVLELARERGWRDLHGVEPSADALSHAAPGIAEQIRRDVMRPGLFAPESFAAVTMFQLLDHVADPVALLRECRKVLRPGGVILALNHNVAAVSARLLGERSPIIDVEHTYLYSPLTMRRLFEIPGFTDIVVRPIRNTYSLAYLARLLPLPGGVKGRLLRGLRNGSLARASLTVPLGNLCLTARRPA